ncbi:hypothetical protein CI102_3966 [Trichoderma harzianum]|nr:hypothetical protein CI102_3966 [Trichoderma harzianum]
MLLQVSQISVLVRCTHSPVFTSLVNNTIVSRPNCTSCSLLSAKPKDTQTHFRLINGYSHRGPKAGFDSSSMAKTRALLYGSNSPLCGLSE